MLGEYDSRLIRSERNRVDRYREQVERFREIAKMETEPRVRTRLLELAGQYEQLVDDLVGPGPRRSRQHQADDQRG
jgi:hypothetical protein